MIIGPQVAFVDDKEEQIRPLEDAIQDLNAGTIYFDATPEAADYPSKPIETIELIFLDLYYKKDFDAYASAQWVEKIIPENAQYSLIIWSKDVDVTEELLDILATINRTPVYIEKWQKTDFDIQKFDFTKKIGDLISNISKDEHATQDVILGEIIEVEEFDVLIYCRIHNENPVYQMRQFDRELLGNVQNLVPGTYVRIIIYTRLMGRFIHIFEEKRDLTDLFSVPDYFKGLEGSAFFSQD
jgi:hypothetical protein